MVASKGHIWDWDPIVLGVVQTQQETIPAQKGLQSEIADGG